MHFNVDYKYKRRIEELSAKYRKFTPVFDANRVTEVYFELGNNEVLISRNTSFNEERSIYRFRQIKKIISFTDGLLIIFKDKKFIFLPVVDNETADDDLVYIAHTFYEQMMYKFSVKERLYTVNYNSASQKKKRLNLSITESPVFMIIISVLAALLGLVVIAASMSYEPVSRDKCIAYTGEYASFEKDEDDTIYLYFKNDEEQWIDYSCYSSELFTEIASFEKGESVKILLHPDNEYVVELKCKGKEILNLDFAQKAMREDAKGMEWLGYFIIAIGAVSLLFGVIRITIENAAKKRIERETA